MALQQAHWKTHFHSVPLKVCNCSEAIYFKVSFFSCSSFNTNDCYDKVCKHYTTSNVDKTRQLMTNPRGSNSVRTRTTGIPNTLWCQMCMSKTVISLVWVSKKTKTLSEMQDRPTTTHYSTSSSTNKQETMRFLNKQCFLL